MTIDLSAQQVPLADIPLTSAGAKRGTTCARLFHDFQQLCGMPPGHAVDLRHDLLFEILSAPARRPSPASLDRPVACLLEHHGAVNPPPTAIPIDMCGVVVALHPARAASPERLADVQHRTPLDEEVRDVQMSRPRTRCAPCTWGHGRVVDPLQICLPTSIGMRWTRNELDGTVSPVGSSERSDPISQLMRL